MAGVRRKGEGDMKAGKRKQSRSLGRLEGTRGGTQAGEQPEVQEVLTRSCQSMVRRKAKAKHEKQKFTEKKPKQEKLDSPIPRPPLPGGDDSSSTGSDTEKDDGNEAEDGD